MLRPYQQRTIQDVAHLWDSGTRNVLVVSPTGSGKTEMGIEAVRGRRALWVVHTTDLLTQAAKRLRAALAKPVGIIQGSVPVDKRAEVHVGTVQTMLGRSDLPDVELIVLDEAHHYVADEWGLLPYQRAKALRLGLTATPERGDGRPLGDMFDELVVAASIQELTDQGYLVPAHVYRPETSLGAHVAMPVAEAALRFATGGKAFAFCPRVELCYEAKAELKRHALRAEVIEYRSSKSERIAHLDAFRAGRVHCLLCVDTLTEGVDVPDAEVAILGRSYGYPGKLIQATGRVLRSAPGKTRALVIDLSGTTHVHGLPTDPREYSLEGTAIGTTGVVREATSYEGFAQQVVGGELVPAPGCPPLPVLPAPPAAAEGHMSKRWKELLNWAKREGKSKAVASAMYHREFGCFP